jgi:hypothetical protein
LKTLPLYIILTKTYAALSYIYSRRVFMAASALSVLSGIAAAAAGLAGEKVSKDGSVPGLDMAAIVPALLGGNKTGGGGAASLIGGALSAVTKSGVLKNTKLGDMASLAGSLISIGETGKATKKAEGLEGLAAAIAGNSGSGANLASIAKIALTLAGTVKNNKELSTLATKLGKTLSSKFGISFNGGATALKALTSVLGGDAKGELFKAVLKGLT